LLFNGDLFDLLIRARSKTVIFSPASGGTLGSNYNPRNISMYSCGYNFRLPPLTVRDLRLDLEKIPSFRSGTNSEHPEITLYLTAQVSILLLNIVPTPVYNTLIAAN